VTIRALPYGPTAVMFEVTDVGTAIAVATELRRAAIAGVVEIVPAARTILVQCADQAGRRAVEALAQSLRIDRPVPTDGVLVEVPTVYDGTDLAEVAAASGLSVEAVIDLHRGAEYRAAFCGFAPGFAYLTGLAAVLHLPRRANPRPSVSAGSVAIGADFTGVYPTASPGGWHLLGHTDVAMWDPARARPALIEPGDRVRFVAVHP
jgi:5-oxoprolinase (ATP-hydrolysing) subunit B